MLGPVSDVAAPRQSLGSRTAGFLVAGSSAAVLVVELVALRLLAPYLGLTLETSTLVIGTALTAIAAGAWLGGRAADATDPRRLLGPALGISGAVVAVTPAAVRTSAELAPPLFLLLALFSILVPGALLSAVTPIVTTLRLSSLAETGTVVGRLSGLGTAGAIAGTVVTGFVLISRVPVSTILVGLGVLLLLGGLVVDLRVRGWGTGSRIGAAAVVAAGGLGAVVAPGGCDVETTYHCAVVMVDPDRDAGRTLVLDGLRHSYVDLADPTYLEFDYVKALASVSDAAYPDAAEDAALRTHFLGAGGATLPRYLDAVRPGTRTTVSEIDGGVVDLDVEQLGLVTGDGIDVRVEDARLGLDDLGDDSRDLMVGDAFGGISVPWHLTTVELLAEVDRVLAPDGVYAANLIDHGPLAFARAEVATLAAVFDHVVVLAPADVVERTGGGNLVAVASDREVDADAITARMGERDLDWQVLSGEALADWVGDAQVLTDDEAPVDQLLTPYGA